MKIVTAWLNHPRLPLHLAVLAVLLTLPALWLGLVLDDYLYRGFMLDLFPDAVRNNAGHFKIFSAFEFINGNIDKNLLSMELGILPWWMAEDFRLAFFRPLASLSLWIDYKLWPDLPVLMHLKSLVWYGALVAAAAFLYRRVIGMTWIAGLAALLFTVDYRHGIPSAWLANRYALISVFFGILCLIAYDYWRRTGKKWPAFAAPACFVFALLSGEIALAVAGYLFAYALFLDNAKLSRRFLALLPCAVISLIWAGIFLVFNYGMRGSGMYMNPIETPVEFARAFITRAPVLLMGQWSPLQSQMGLIIHPNTMLVISLIIMAVLIFILFPLVRKDRVARFWALGMVLSLVPIASGDPNDRYLIFVGVGAMGLLAQFLGGLISGQVLPAARFWRVPAVAIGIILVIVHLVYSPLALPNMMKGIKLMGDFFGNHIKSIPNDPVLSGQSLILVNPPDFHNSVGQALTMRLAEGKRIPRRIRFLSAGPGPVEIHRLDDRSLRVRTPGGLCSGFFGAVYYVKERPLAVGQEFKLSDMSIRVVHLDKEYGPDEVMYRFSVPLEDRSLRWLRLNDKGVYVPYAPPQIGKSDVLQGLDMMDIYIPKKKDRKS